MSSQQQQPQSAEKKEQDGGGQKASAASAAATPPTPGAASSASTPTTSSVYRTPNQTQSQQSKQAGEEKEERPQTMHLLSKFLMEEQDKRAKLREEHHLNSTWKDLQSAYEAAPVLDWMGQHGEDMYDTFNSNNEGAGGNLVNRLALAATRSSQNFIGSSPENQALLKQERKTRKERKKKKKDAKKEAKKQARMMIVNRSNARF